MNKEEKNIKEDKQELEIPVAMQGSGSVVELIQQFRKDDKVSPNNMELSKYVVMEGMQNEDKVPFFTQFDNRDDEERCNTIEAYNPVSLLIIRKTSEKNMKRIMQLNQDVYVAHIRTHKRNMVSVGRKREDSYTRILSSDSSDSGVVPTGIRKFFGIGGKK